MRLYTVLLLVASTLGFAQAPPAAPPADVDQALRAQATAFLKYQMEGNYRKAYELVAEDSQDYYLGAPKEKPASLELQVEYSDNFTRAVVTSTSKQVIILEARSFEIPGGRSDRWKLENGQWKWYHDASKDMMPTLVGPMPVGSPGSPATPPQLPKDLGPDAVAKASKTIPPPSATINRNSVPFTVGKEATEEVVFHNSAPGEVRVDADLIADYPGFVVQPKSFQLKPREEAVFRVTYRPSDKGVFRASLRLTVQPFESEFRIPLILSNGSTAGKP